MKTLLTSTLALIGIISGSALAKSLTLDASASTVKWTGKKVTGQHNGTLALKSGTIEIDKNVIKGGQFDLDMSSIKNEDITDAKNNAKLVGHLKSDDFFGVDTKDEKAKATNATSTFKITSVKELKGQKDATHEITGDLTIKGQTHPVTFPAMVDIKGDKASAKGKVVVDRTKYNIKYSSGKFFDNLGDKMINDNFEVDLDLKTK